MSAPSTISWKELFGAKERADFTLPVKVIRKAGEPWLILSGPPAVAVQALSLYPAQTKFARAARRIFRWAMLGRLPLGLGRAAVQISLGDPFPRFLTKLAGAKAGEFPSLAILAGNPRVEARRFIVLLFDESDQAAWVVKTGIGEPARRLIQKESSFLQSAPADAPGVPKVRQTFSSEHMAALALAYVAGDSPAREDWPGVAKLLTGWVGGAKRARVDNVAAWKILEKEQGSNQLFRTISSALQGFEFCPALVHGDFAPWNIKVSPVNGSWMALDWERGELVGFPGWDWFHYVIQTGILVEKLSPKELMRKLEELFSAPMFRDYAERTGIRSREKALAAGYLFHCVKVTRPTEGRETAEALLSLLGEQWLTANP